VFRKKPKRAPSGGRLLHHTEAAPGAPSAGDPALRAAVVAHVEEHLGPIAFTWEDPDPDHVRVDVHVVAPTPRFGGYRLVTSGMAERHGGDRRQPTELIVNLRPDWPGITGDADARWRWPVDLLRDLAKLPHRYRTHLNTDHTVPNGDPAEPYAPDTALCCALLAPPLTTSAAFDELVVDGDTVMTLGVVLLYADEMRLKLDRGADALWDELDEAGVNEAVVVDRPSALG
jgi:hypothetical protein